jgi:hypothetical protein
MRSPDQRDEAESSAGNDFPAMRCAFFLLAFLFFFEMTHLCWQIFASGLTLDWHVLKHTAKSIICSWRLQNHGYVLEHIRLINIPLRIQKREEVCEFLSVL